MASRSNDPPSELPSPTNGNDEYTLILTKGRGSKRRFNNKRARLVNAYANSGGWITVQVEGQEERIKWRNKAWKRIKTSEGSTLSFESLPDECLVKVFSFLGAGDYEAHANPEEEYSEEEISSDLSPEYVKIKLRLKDAVKLHKTIALLSKRFFALCSRNIATILGHLDADLIVNDWHRFTPWLTKNALRLKSLAIKSEVFEDCVILVYILRKCDVSRLATLSALFKSFGPRHNETMWTMVELAHGGDRSHVDEQGEIISTHLPVSLETLKIKATSLGLPGLYDHPLLCNRQELHDYIADLCPSLVSLKIVHDLGDNVDPNISSGILFQKQSIRQLNLVLCIAVMNRSLEFRQRFDTTSVSEVVSALPNLKVLKFLNGDYNNIHDITLRLASNSLQKIDLLDAGKNNWITTCVCPRLMRLICLSTPYGNGVRPRGDSGEIELIGINEGEYLAGTARFDGTLEWSGETIVFEGLKVPNSCVVTVRSH